MFVFIIVFFFPDPSFEAATLSPWQTSGSVFQGLSAQSFEGDQAAFLGPNTGDIAILSQLFLVPTNGSHLHVSWSMRSQTAFTGQWTIELQWFGSANDGLPPLRFDTIFVKAEGALSSVWQTAVVATGAKPSGTVWARIRFTGEVPGGVFLDSVVVTAETS